MLKKYPALLLLIIPQFFSCITFKEVNNYAATSVNSLNKINDLNYSFSAYCKNDCELQQLRAGKIDTAFACDCEDIAAKADQAIQKIHFTIVNYLVAIERLSDNKGFSYNVSGFSDELTKNPLLRINEQQAGIITKAGNTIAAASTAFYRQKKLTAFINQADPVFQELVDVFTYLVADGLRTQLRIHYDTRMANLRQTLANAKGSQGLEQSIVKNALEETAYFKKHDALIVNYSRLLIIVKKGHHELYEHKNSLNEQGIRNLAIKYVAEIQDLAASFKK